MSNLLITNFPSDPNKSKCDIGRPLCRLIVVKDTMHSMGNDGKRPRQNKICIIYSDKVTDEWTGSITNFSFRSDQRAGEHQHPARKKMLEEGKRKTLILPVSHLPSPLRPFQFFLLIIG